MPPLPPHPPRPSYWPWAFATCGLAAILAASLLGFYTLHRVFSVADQLANTPSSIAASLAQAFQPNTHYQTTILTTIGQLNNSPKLVVLSADVDAQVDKSSSTTWAYLYLGTTRVSLRAHHNQIQYILPLNHLSPSSFHYNPFQKTLTLTVPAPTLDPDMISVQSDPSQIEITTSNGWAKLDRWSGAPLRQDAKRALRPAVLNAGQHPLLKTQAQQNATTQLQKLLTPLTTTLAPNTTLTIHFQ